MKRFAISALLVLSMCGAVACGPNTANQAGNQVGNHVGNATNATGAAVRNALNTNPARTNGVENGRRIHAEKRIADRVVNTGLVHQASVLVLGDTAYIGVTQNEGTHGDLSAAHKAQIADVVKKHDSKIKMVYVSANPDVYSHFQTFAGDLAAGRPVSGFWNSFRGIVTRVWPTAR
jgi:spore cortex protein